MKVLIVEPDKVPYEAEIDPGLKSLKTVVDGDIQAVYPFDDPVGIVCNDDSKIKGMPLNRALYDDNGTIYDIIAGKFLVVGLGEKSFDSLSDDMVVKYREQFKHPEKFVRLAGEIIAVKQPIPGDNEKGIKPPTQER